MDQGILKRYNSFKRKKVVIVGCGAQGLNQGQKTEIQD
jgi:ketol-acid reductoisomerase